MAEPSINTYRWYYSHSSTLRSIYVLRYLLFAGGVAVAGALVQRSVAGTERTALGLLLGLAVGLVIFVGQLRSALAPRLALSQDALYLVKRRGMSRLPWESVREVSRDGNRVVLRLSSPIGWASAKPSDEVRLEPRRLGSTAAQLHFNLRSFATDARLRQRLPLDAEVRSRLGKI